MMKTIPLSRILASSLALASCQDPQPNPDKNYTVVPPCPADSTENCVIEDDSMFDDGAPK